MHIKDSRLGSPFPYKMKTAPQTGSFSSVPALQKASQLVLDVVNASQRIRRNKVAFKRLTTDASELVDDMSHFYRIMEEQFPQGVPEDLDFVFQRTVNLLTSLRSFTRDVALRNFFMALLFSHSDVREIKTYDQTLVMARGSFKIISNAYVKDRLTKLSAETLEALAQRFVASGGEETK